jgi:hypothetical protein
MPAASRPFEALRSESVGISEPHHAMSLDAPAFSVSTDADINLGGHIFKKSPWHELYPENYPYEYPFLHNEGFANTSLGLYALTNVDPSGFQAGSGNTAVGQAALYNNTSGRRNTAVGIGALYPTTTSMQNTAVGWWAMASYTPSGDRNTALGALAGYYTYGSDNILIGNSGVPEDSNTLRIGNGTGTGSFELDRVFIHGIHGRTATGGINVYVNSAGQLGTATSSRRFKEGIEDIGDVSTDLLSLRPVTFSLRQEGTAGTPPREFGLIAEEVAEVFPDLVVFDEADKPLTVRYHLLSTLLLNEVQRQHRQIKVLQVLLGAILVLGLGWTASRWRVG